MKITFGLLALLTLMVVFSSCEEDILIKGEFRQKYTLNGIVNGDDSTQFVSILQNYDVEGIDPSINEENMFISGAYVRMWYKDTVYILTDTLISITKQNGQLDEVGIYYTNDFKPAFGERVEIEALLENGRRLKSYTDVPKKIDFVLDEVGVDESAREIPGPYENKFELAWSSVSNKQFYRPRFKIIYDRYFAYDDTRRYEEVPSEYIESEGEYIPVYSGITQGGAGYFSLEALDIAMQKISEGMPVKSGFRIMLLQVEVTIVDQFLAAYYSSSGNLQDEYSISLDKSDYTNIEGGFGIFGSKIIQKTSFTLEPDYIKSFGYNPFYE
ncbi:MAG: DUF4249 family protein [Bacteroidetes bacterium]|nr:DUF4249 family protein [Bacteroidota bacterium]